jgi:hypothetical protein
MEQWWTKSDRGRSEYSVKIKFQCHFVEYEPHSDWPENETEKTQKGDDGHNAVFLMLKPEVHIVTTLNLKG